MVLKHRPTCRALHMFGDAKSTSTLRSVGGGISSGMLSLGECTLDALVLDESENKTLDLAHQFRVTTNKECGFESWSHTCTTHVLPLVFFVAGRSLQQCHQLGQRSIPYLNVC